MVLSVWILICRRNIVYLQGESIYKHNRMNMKQNKKKLNEQIDMSKWMTVDEARQAIGKAFLQLKLKK